MVQTGEGTYFQICAVSFEYMYKLPQPPLADSLTNVLFSVYTTLTYMYMYM